MTSHIPLMSVEDLTVGLDRSVGGAELLRGVSFGVSQGERVAIVGESGSGKSLTALAMMRLLAPGLCVTGGRILFDGVDLASLSSRALRRYRGGRVSMVYQDPMSSLNPLRTIGSQVVESLRLHRDGLSNAAAKSLALAALDEVGIRDSGAAFRCYPYEYSGGMRQRVVIAMATCTNPDLIIADEPTTALDVTTQARILELLSESSRQRGMALILVTHDLAVASQLADRILVMYAGRVVESSAADEFFTDPLHPYSRGLLGSAIDLNTDKNSSLETIPGSPPLPGHTSGGCRFRDRCASRVDLCTRVEPRHKETNGRLVECHVVASPREVVDD